MSESFGDDSLFQSDDEGETKMSVGQAATNVTATAMAAAAVPVGAVSAQAASNRMPIPTDPLRMPSVPKLPSPTSMADQAKSKAKAAASMTSKALGLRLLGGAPLARQGAALGAVC